LSKPCTKLDYLIGKWLSVFLPIFTIVFVPAMLFYAYAWLSYPTYGIREANLLLPIFGMAAVSGIFHASVVLAVSSCFNQARIAGAVFSGMFFLPWFFTKAMQIGWAMSETSRAGSGKLPGLLYYASMDGIQIGLAKLLLNYRGDGVFRGLQQLGQNNPNARPRNRNAMANVGLPDIPPVGIMVPALVIIVCVCLLICWNRVRAVEVVG
jgi:ABC-2 type transport system permease protein